MWRSGLSHRFVEPTFVGSNPINRPIYINKNLLNVRTINEIDIKILDEDNNLINFNNLDWNITLIITTEINFDQQEVSLNTLLKNNYLDLTPQEEDINDGLIEDKNNIEIPIKTQQEKELDILNY